VAQGLPLRFNTLDGGLSAAIYADNDKTVVTLADLGSGEGGRIPTEAQTAGEGAPTCFSFNQGLLALGFASGAVCGWCAWLFVV
jgi:hypothetical protein